MNARDKKKYKYDTTHCVRVGLKLNVRTDYDILCKLAEVESMQGYIRDLIRKDLKRNPPNLYGRYNPNTKEILPTPSDDIAGMLRDSYAGRIDKFMEKNPDFADELLDEQMKLESKEEREERELMKIED